MIPCSCSRVKGTATSSPPATNMIQVVAAVTSAPLEEGVRIIRGCADTNILFPTTAKRLTRFMMDSNFGECRPLSVAWAQVSNVNETSKLWSRHELL